MKAINCDPSEIDQLLNTLRIFNTSIGSYQQHTALEEYSTYSVQLTNGTIRIYFEELQDKQSMPQERLKDIAARFSKRK